MHTHNTSAVLAARVVRRDSQLTIERMDDAEVIERASLRWCEGKSSRGDPAGRLTGHHARLD